MNPLQAPESNPHPRQSDRGQNCPARKQVHRPGARDKNFGETAIGCDSARITKSKDRHNGQQGRKPNRKTKTRIPRAGYPQESPCRGRDQNSVQYPADGVPNHLLDQGAHHLPPRSSRSRRRCNSSESSPRSSRIFSANSSCEFSKKRPTSRRTSERRASWRASKDRKSTRLNSSH